MTQTIGYGKTVAICGCCKQILEKAPSNYDGEPTFSGYLPCPRHPLVPAEYRAIDQIIPMNHNPKFSVGDYALTKVAVRTSDDRQVPAGTLGQLELFEEQSGDWLVEFPDGGDYAYVDPNDLMPNET